MSGFKSCLLLVFIVLAGASQAHAADSLNFNGKANEREKALLAAYALDHLKTPLEDLAVARPDLNGDGLGEYIVRVKCEALCSFAILAESKDKIVELGKIEAREIQLGNAYSGSVRNIIAFKDAVNDYGRTVYSWEPKSARYMIKEQDEPPK